MNCSFVLLWRLSIVCQQVVGNNYDFDVENERSLVSGCHVFQQRVYRQKQNMKPAVRREFWGKHKSTFPAHFSKVYTRPHQSPRVDDHVARVYVRCFCWLVSEGWFCLRFWCVLFGIMTCTGTFRKMCSTSGYIGLKFQVSDYKTGKYHFYLYLPHRGRNHSNIHPYDFVFSPIRIYLSEKDLHFVHQVCW